MDKLQSYKILYPAVYDTQNFLLWVVLFNPKSTVDLLIIAVVIGKKAVLTFRFMWVQVVTGTKCEHKLQKHQWKI